MDYRLARARQRRGNGDPCHRTRRHAVPRWPDRIRPCSLGWVTARLPGGDRAAGQRGRGRRRSPLV